MNFTWHGPEFRKDSASTIYADLFSTTLNLNSSKWKQALIDKGLALYAALNYTTDRYVGPIEIFVVPNPSKLKECYTEVMNQVSHFSDPDYITDEQLQTAKDVLRRNQIRSTEKPSDLPGQPAGSSVNQRSHRAGQAVDSEDADLRSSICSARGKCAARTDPRSEEFCSGWAGAGRP